MTMMLSLTCRRCLAQLNSPPVGRSFNSFTSTPSALQHPTSPRRRTLHASPGTFLPRKRDFFSSNASLKDTQPSRREGDGSADPQRKRRQARIPPGKTSLRRVAVEAQRSRERVFSGHHQPADAHSRTKTVTAYCAADQFDLARVVQILETLGHEIDPYETRLAQQVVHIQIALPETEATDEPEYGDIFVFSSGTVVAWSVPETITSELVTKTLLPAAENPKVDRLETEDLEYVEDSLRENSSIRGDTITLGTLTQTSSEETAPPQSHDAHGPPESTPDPAISASSARRDKAGAVLAKIAFSSGLARSTKLAVLETLLSDYFESTRSIPTMLSRGSRLPFTRSFILRKTGQLLSVRAQLNLYSELTDSLPDLFWDSRHELGLEGYYDQVGRALDVGVRIKTLNEKMDYAQEIASVLRERLSEKHGLVLEWMIIALITIEVAFEVLRLWKERVERIKHEQEAMQSLDC